MPETLGLDEQRSATHDALTAYSDTFLEYKRRNERTGGLDSALLGEFRAVNEHMDYLLERYFSLIAGVELDYVLPREVDVRLMRQDEEDQAWAEYGVDWMGRHEAYQRQLEFHEYQLTQADRMGFPEGQIAYHEGRAALLLQLGAVATETIVYPQGA